MLDVVLGVTAFNQSVRAAVDAPRIHHQWLPDRISFERYALSPDTQERLVTKGHTLRENSSTQGQAMGILFDHETGYLTGAADSRAADGGVAGY